MMPGRSPAERRLAIHTAPPDVGEGLALACHCAIDAEAAHFGCLECGAPCCSACAITLESVAYCRECATTLLDVAVIPKSGSFELY